MRLIRSYIYISLKNIFECRRCRHHHSKVGNFRRRLCVRDMRCFAKITRFDCIEMRFHDIFEFAFSYFDLMRAKHVYQIILYFYVTHTHTRTRAPFDFLFCLNLCAQFVIEQRTTHILLDLSVRNQLISSVLVSFPESICSADTWHFHRRDFMFSRQNDRAMKKKMKEKTFVSSR